MQDGLTLPTNKTELVEYLERGDVIPFHKYVCSSCHLVPKYEEWKTLPVHGKLKKNSNITPLYSRVYIARMKKSRLVFTMVF